MFRPYTLYTSTKLVSPWRWPLRCSDGAAENFTVCLVIGAREESYESTEVVFYWVSKGFWRSCWKRCYIRQSYMNKQTNLTHGTVEAESYGAPKESATQWIGNRWATQPIWTLWRGEKMFYLYQQLISYSPGVLPVAYLRSFPRQPAKCREQWVNVRFQSSDCDYTSSLPSVCCPVISITAALSAFLFSW